MVLTFLGAYAKLEQWDQADIFLILGTISQIVALIILVFFIVRYFINRSKTN